MCRNIKRLFNYDPAVSRIEMEAAELQFVRKISGYRQPSVTNERAFDRAVEKISGAAAELLAELTTNAPARNREQEILAARTKAAKRYADRT